MAQLPTQLSVGSLSGPAKLKAVTSLMGKLTHDVEKRDLQPDDRDAALEELKVYGRDPRNADPIFTKEGIRMLTRYAFDSPSDKTARAALRCLANAMLINPATRQMFVDLGYEAKACNKLKSNNLDDEFLVSRVIFLTTYGTKIDLLSLIDEYHLASTIVQNLARHVDLLAKSSGKAQVDPMQDMALAETAKLLFNVTHFCGKRSSSFTPAIAHIAALLCKHELPSPRPLDPPLGSLVNALLNLELESEKSQSALFPKNRQQNVVTDRLIRLLDLSIRHYDESELDNAVTPLVSVIRRVHEISPESVRQYIRGRLLPTDEDRKEVLGHGENLSSVLLRNSTNPMTPQLRDEISHLMFELSDKDAYKFVENVGYGFASGFLFQNNMAIPESVSSATGPSSKAEPGKAFNPVTGQFLDAEKHPEIPEMTLEEKEREAERLFVLFERLKQTGIVDVENPVTKAYREGRFQEIDDDDRVEELN